MALITDKCQLLLSPSLEAFSSSEFIVSIASASYNLLQKFFLEKDLHIFQNIIKDQLTLDVFDGPPRTRLQIDCRRGAIFGESPKGANKEPVLYGLLPHQKTKVSPDENTKTQNEDEEHDQEDPVNKKRRRRDGGKSNIGGGKSGSKLDSNSPAIDRIPLPVLSERTLKAVKQIDEQRRSIQKARSQLKSTNTASGTSVVLYTLVNVDAGESAVAIRRGGLLTSTFSADSSWLATGFGSGRIRIWSLNQSSLKRLKPSEALRTIDPDSSNVESVIMYDEGDKKLPYRDLLGHTNGVHGLAMSTDKSILVSASSDSTVRLWSSQTWGGALTLWRDHLAPVWSVDLLPLHANYLVSGSADRTVHLYATDHGADALRIFYGHLADVTAVRLHPNANYVASGSADRACRLFDVRSGKMVRLYTGHKGSIQALTFSPCGRYLVSGGWGGAVCLWDLGSGHQVGQLGGYLASSSSSSSGGEWLTGPVTALTYPPNSSSSLAACGLDGAVRIWNTAAASPVPAENKQANPVAAGKRTDSGLVQLHRGAKHSHQQLSAAKSASHYYSSQAGAEVSHACLKELFFTRRTPVLGASYLVDSSLLLTCGAYNAHDGK